MKTANSIFKIFLVALLLAVQVHFAYAQTAALLPVAPQQFFDKNGNPVSSGSVGYYIPGTSTPKMVWQDDSQTTPWTNPITLNAGGWPPNNKGIYGNGIYRQIIKDKNNNIISDQPTSATGSGGGSGTSVGDGNSVGTILAWSGMIAPNQYQFAYGQSLSRATYPELYQAITLATDVVCVGGNATLTSITDTSNIPVGAALEGNCIVAGSTVISKTINTVTLSIAANISTTTNVRFFPYGNGNGTTTFNAPDLRGKVIPGRNNMGGVVSSNLTSTYYGSSPDAVGANGGTQSKLISLTQMPSHRHSVFLNDPGHLHAARVDSAFSVGSGTGLTPVGSGTQTMGAGKDTSVGTTDPNFTGITVRDTSGGGGTANQTALTGGSDPISVISPSITMNYIIKVTPDTSISGLFGVASIGGMQGIIACGTGLTCAGNVISAVASIPSVNAIDVTYSPPFADAVPLSQAAYNIRNVSVDDFGAAGDGVTDDTINIQKAIDSCGENCLLQFSAKTYKITSCLNQTYSYQEWRGAGKNVTTISFEPNSNGSAICYGDGLNSLFYLKLAGFQIYSPDITFTKTAIEINDVRGFEIEDVNIDGIDIGVGGSNSWGGGAGSTGIRIAGREFIHIHSSVTVVAEKPIVIAKNLNSFIDFDHSFINAYLVADNFPNITIDGTANYLSNSSFSGAWSGGTYGFYFDATTSSTTSHNLSFSNIRIEQGQSGTSYNFYLDGGANLIQSLSFNDVYPDINRNGFRLRGVLSASIGNTLYGSTTKVAIDAATTSNLTLINCYWQTGATASLVGLNTIRKGPVVPFGAPLPMDAYYSNRAPEIVWPSNTGTFAVSSSAPLVLNSTTGNLTITGAALTKTDDTNITLTLGGSSSTALVNAASITAGWTGTLSVSRGGTGASTAVGASQNLGYCWVDQSAVAVSVTGTTVETTLATISIPSGGLGANGSIKVTRLITFSNNANVKTFRDRFGGIGGTSYNTYSPTTTSTARYDTEIHNRGVANSQIGFAAGVGPNIAGSGIGFTSGAAVTSAVDTSLSTTMVLTVQNANAGDTSTLEYWKAEICYKP